MQGKIVKGIAGFYYVHVAGSGIYECKAKGVFRKEKIKPLVGDDVLIDVLDEMEHTGNVIRVLPRKNELLRPAAANVDQAVVIFAVRRPEPILYLLDCFLVTMAQRNVPACICFNKVDLAKEGEPLRLEKIYAPGGYDVIFTSALRGEGIKQLKDILRGKTSIVAGPSGAGKSSLINCLVPGAGMETGAVSEKSERGRHTTRHSELLVVEDGTYIMDTPGFASLTVDCKKEELQAYFPEIAEYEPLCRFSGCSHINEPDCGVKAALAEGKIHPVRYENYAALYGELKDRKKC